jgi:hypothetical protein
LTAPHIPLTNTKLAHYVASTQNSSNLQFKSDQIMDSQRRSASPSVSATSSISNLSLTSDTSTTPHPNHVPLVSQYEFSFRKPVNQISLLKDILLLIVFLVIIAVVSVLIFETATHVPYAGWILFAISSFFLMRSLEKTIKRMGSSRVIAGGNWDVDVEMGLLEEREDCEGEEEEERGRSLKRCDEMGVDGKGVSRTVRSR